MFKRALMLSLVIVVLFSVYGCIEQANTNDVSSQGTEDTFDSLANNNTNSNFRYLEKEWNGFQSLKPIQNGALMTLSQYGFSGANCTYFRSNLENDTEQFFTISNNTIVAYLTFDEKLSDTVKKFLETNYSSFIGKEPKIETAGVSTYFFWELDGKTLFVEAVNHNYPSKEYYESKVISYGEYSDIFNYNKNSQKEYPGIVTDYITSIGYQMSDFDYGGYTNYEGAIFDVFYKVGGSPLWLYFKLDTPQKILSSQEYLENLKVIEWESNKPIDDTNDNSLEEPSDKNNHSDTLIKIQIADNEQLDDTVNFLHYYDTKAYMQTFNIVIEVSENIRNFRFIELDESEILKVSDTLIEYETLEKNKPLILHTYINDITLNRGLAYQDETGAFKYLGFYCNMEDGSISLSELDFGKFYKSSYSPHITDSTYMWENNDVFEKFFTDNFNASNTATWVHLGISGNAYNDSTDIDSTWFDIYRVDFSDERVEYYAIPYGEIQMTKVFKIQYDDTLVLLWSVPLEEYYPWMK